MKQLGKRTLTALLALCLAASLAVPALAAVPYLPDVTAEMSAPGYWADLCGDPDRVLMTPEEIAAQNQAVADASGTMVIDLRTAAQTFDGKARNEAIAASAKADAEYYLGWTYGPDGQKADWSYYEAMVKNCTDPKAKASQPVRYGVAVNRTTIHTFPSDDPIWDDPTDPDFNYQPLSALRVNEPVLLYTTSADGKFYLARSQCCSGWVPAEDVAICADREAWLEAWDIPADQCLTVCASRYVTADSNYAPETAKRLLTMGTTLRLVDPASVPGLVNNRSAYHNYIVELPLRGEDGSYEKGYGLIPETAKVREGLLPLTQRNIVSVALNALGDPYGWGGMLESDDCSGLVRAVYACFGLILPRNTTWQANTPAAALDLSNTSNEEKALILDQLPMGAVLIFPGHEMLYLGKSGENYYVVSSVSNIMDPADLSKKLRARDVMVSTLNLGRANGHTWLQDLNKVFMPAYGEAVKERFDFPGYQWYHDGAAYCMKSGLLPADSQGRFAPEENADRASLAQAMWRLAGKPESDGELSFTDLEPDSPAAEAIRWAVEAGVFTGYSEEKFGPEDPLTREQLVTVLWRFAGYEGMDRTVPEDASLQSFPDFSQVSDYARDPIQWACRAGILIGDKGKLKPKDFCTRAELAVILLRYDSLRTAGEEQEMTP